KPTASVNSTTNKVAHISGATNINHVKENTSVKNTNTSAKTTNPKTGDESELPFVFGAIVGLGLLISVNLRKVKERILKSNK
ncbi:MAG: LPXTG cell wall anchor domain-containing protein, partial [Clostridium sp.]|uniref:LPXTG cell wall anchor domain-containing protein n=1 Tax=Clostridium sp. TaxID=1506 RepID=UPI003EE675A3